MCVSGNIVNKFFFGEHQKRTLFVITEHFITTNEHFITTNEHFVSVKIFIHEKNVVDHILLYY